jgi:hypothetical protein
MLRARSLWLETQSRNNSPQAHDNQINTHSVAQKPGIYEHEDSKNKSYNSPYQTKDESYNPENCFLPAGPPLRLYESLSYYLRLP